MKTLKYKKFEEQQMLDMPEKEFKKSYFEFNRTYDKYYKKYVLDSNEKDEDIFKQIDEMDKQLGIFQDVAKQRNITISETKKQ
jgi:hypothetical protein